MSDSRLASSSIRSALVLGALTLATPAPGARLVDGHILWSLDTGG